ncbi:hypothetical protein [Massilia sp. Root335]|uniref:hypothetical protein n=1 Tax=Massilia sp. Root335 TaxID=1736517 RepID=UPI000ABA95C0|nr:hypothetical protein [Massilia sp. Root335]
MKLGTRAVGVLQFGPAGALERKMTLHEAVSHHDSSTFNINKHSFQNETFFRL